jgi:hypothetical protein
MLGSFLPPVLFEVQANATQAIATFGKVNTQLKTMEAQAIKTGKAISGMQKAVVIGTGALKALGAIAVVSMAIGVKAVMDLEKSMNRLGQAMSNVGVSTKENREQVAKLVDSYEELGFGSEKAADAYAVLITATGNVEKSNRLLALSADLARAKNMGMEEAARALIRAQNGNARVFKEFGIILDANKPKAIATAEAMKQLEQRLGGQAQAYAKTFAGQLAILNENLGDLFEAIGMKVLPVLNRFVSALNNTGSWIKKNNDFVIAFAAAITVALIPAVVNLTKKLALLALTILRSPIARIAAVVFAIAYSFVKAYNASEDFRAKVGAVGKWVLGVVQNIVAGYESLERGIMMVVQAGMKMRLEWAKWTRNKDMENQVKKDLANWEKQYAAIGKYSQAIENAKKKIDEFTSKKLEIKWDFKVPQIPGFGNGTGAGGLGDTLAADIAKGLAKAELRFKEFARDIANVWKTVTGTFKNIVTKDFDKLIYDRIGDPIDTLIYQAQTAIDNYEAASGQWADANAALVRSQDAYIAALKTGKDELIANAESVLGYAEGAVAGLADAMAAALAEVEKLQEDMINAVADMYEQISQLESDRTKILQAAQKERIILEKDYNKQVARLRKDYDASVIAAEAEAARRRAEIVKTSVDQLRSAFRSATYRTLGSVYENLTYEGRYLKGGSIEKILKTLGLQTEKAKTLADNAAKLAGLGFSQTFIEEVVALGPDMGNSLASTILNSTPQSIEQLRTYWRELENTSLHGVDGIAKALNSGITLATEELTAQLAQVDIDLKAQLAESQIALTDSLTEAFNNYSEALDEINQRTAEQIRAIDAQIAELNAKIAMLREALGKLSGIATPGTGGGTNIIPRAVTTEEEGAASSCESGKGVFKVITYNGQVMSRTLVRCIPKISKDSPITPEKIQDPEKITEVVDTRTAAQKQIDTLTALRASTTSGTAINFLLKEHIDTLKDTAMQSASTMVDEQTRLRELRFLERPGITAASSFDAGSFRMRENEGMTINITANTNASAQDIANDVGWAIRTSGDVQYRVPNPYGGRLGER